ncbi:MAG: CAP domain-containing protein [Longimicrobiaceae bacterium]
MNALARRLAAAALAAPLAACASPAPPAAAPSQPAPPSAGSAASPDEMATEVARLVNEHRARIGCPPLAWDALAARAAQAHSDDMARRGFFSHVSPEGRNVGDRLRAAGANWRAVGENIAQGQPTAQVVVRGWLASPGHRENIENCAYTRQGVGYRDRYWTHVFYTPMPGSADAAAHAMEALRARQPQRP